MYSDIMPDIFYQIGGGGGDCNKCQKMGWEIHKAQLSAVLLWFCGKEVDLLQWVIQ